MSVEQISDSERLLLCTLLTEAWVKAKRDTRPHTANVYKELLRKLNGVDKVVTVEVHTYVDPDAGKTID